MKLAKTIFERDKMHVPGRDSSKMKYVLNCPQTVSMSKVISRRHILLSLLLISIDKTSKKKRYRCKWVFLVYITKSILYSKHTASLEQRIAKHRLHFTNRFLTIIHWFWISVSSIIIKSLYGKKSFQQCRCNHFFQTSLSLNSKHKIRNMSAADYP